MANYCDNVLQVTGEVKEMNRFIAMCKTNDSDFSLRGIVPAGNTSDEVKVAWGVNADVEDLDVSVGEEWVEYKFRTNWVEPKLWFEKVVHEFPSLHLILFFCETGNGLAGYHEKQRAFTEILTEQFEKGTEDYYIFLHTPAYGNSLSEEALCYSCGSEIDRYTYLTNQDCICDSCKGGTSHEAA